MAAEGASDALGPRYATPDPSLPEPWKGLVDGSSGVLYYWNPETNITQYEKPTALPPPVPPASKPASISTAQPNGVPGQGQQPHQLTQNTQQFTPQPDQQGGPAMQQMGHHFRPQMQPQQGNNMPQSHSQGYPFPHQQMQYGGYQPNMPPQQMQQYPHQQDHRPAFPQRDDGNSQTGAIAPPGQATQYGGSQFSMQQQPPSFGQHGPNFQNQMGQPLLHGQQPNAPPVGMKMGFEDNPPGRGGGNDPYFNAKNDVPNQPKLAAIPMARMQPVKYCIFYLLLSILWFSPVFFMNLILLSD